MSKLFTLFLIAAFQLGYIILSLAQSGEIIGTVIDNETEPLVNATVALYEPGGDEIIEGTATSVSGNFSLEVTPGTYNLKITFLSFQEFEQLVEISAGQTLDLETIQLTPSQEDLGDLEVQGQRSYMEMNFDSRSFNVEDDITSLGGSALDVLDNVPSISTDFEGNVSLRGNQGVQILINGRPSNLVRNGTDALSSIPASLIEEVKIITNPSARYSADGTGGIIDIILVDDAQLGFNGSIRANAGWPQDYGLGANLNYQRRKINWFLNTEIEYENEPENGRTFQSFSRDTTYLYNERSETDEIEREANINFGADIFLPYEQVLTVESRINLENEVEDRISRYTDYLPPSNSEIYRTIDENWSVLQRTNRDIYEDQRESDFDVRAQYEKTFNENRDHQLVADLDFEFGEESGQTDFDQSIAAGTGDELQQRSFSGEVYREARLDVDYEQPVGEEGRLEAGFRLNYDWEDSDYRVEDFRNGNWVDSQQDIGIAENFIYLESVNAAYAIYSGELKPFTYQVGLRAENTLIETELDNSGNTSSQNYTDLFPSLFLSYTLNELNSFQASYSRRISRPWSGELLPFIEIQDDRNRRAGNPNLEPEFSDSYELGYLRYWETGSVLTSVYYRHRTQVVEDVSIIENGITTRTPINLATEDAWGIEFSADQDLFEGLSLSGSLNIYQSYREGEYLGQIYDSEDETFTSRIRIRWQFMEGWNFQSYIFFRGAQQTTQGTRGARSFVGSGLSKELMDGKASISLNVRDLFNSRNSDREIIEPFSYTNSKYSWSSRSFRLNFRYNFGSEDDNGRGRGR
ncbi:MAG: TonB-dependent receptor [Gracilimonas sp.]|nr:TonB-dependent receptor [Gracilimonas sp.]